MEAALKTSCRKEILLKTSPHAILDDLWKVNGQNVVTCDDFFVDDLLDLSNEDGLADDHEPEEEEEKACPSVPTLKLPDQDLQNLNFKPSTSNFSPKEDFGSLPTSELGVPADDLADLEWVSHFVDDSFSEFSAPYPAGILTAKKPSNQAEKVSEPEIPLSVNACFRTPVPAKARSKRTRTGGRVWSLGSPSFTESSSSSTSSSSSSSPSSPWLVYTNTTQNLEPALEPVGFVEKTPSKKPKKKTATDASGSVFVQPPRRCSHCGVQKTPQWRTGPLGAKTLCNACGVRYKSGRLLPEYRPACSPTFSNELHSNHHRKVLEMRRKKELTMPETGLAPPIVPSF